MLQRSDDVSLHGIALRSMAGYSQTPLIKKLGIKPGASVYISDPPDNFFDDLGSIPEGVQLKSRLSAALDFIHLFECDRVRFQKHFLEAATCMKQDGMIWVSWPKKASKMKTDLDENVIREYGLSAGLVDVKVCAVDDIWSGLKFVVRVKDRK